MARRSDPGGPVMLTSQTRGLKSWMDRQCTVFNMPLPDLSFGAKFVHQRRNHGPRNGLIGYNLLFGGVPSDQLATLQKSEHRTHPGYINHQNRQPPSHPCSLT